MPPQIPILAQSENKSKFLERLGISDQSDDGKRLYALMKEEAVAGRARMSSNPQSLLPHLINDPNVKPPYSNTQICENAMHDEILFIYRNARPETKTFYDLGHYVDSDIEENWVIKWLLWHVFRYRDNRNRGRSVSGWNGPRSPPASDLLSTVTTPASEYFNSPISPSDQSRSWETDMVCRNDSGQMEMTSALEKQTSHASSSRSSQSGYWDPVRDAQQSNRR